jgi:predicted 3-demethylubiquinone-9 3-methyltransferase (glyoxalase superfamily)
MLKISPFLWFDNQAEEAINFYTSIFKNSKIVNISRYGEGAPVPAGQVMTATIEIEGQEIMLLNGGPQFKFTEAFSFMVTCNTQEEVDTLWAKLTEGGEEGPCGWLKDKFGLSWQVIPDTLGKLLNDPDPVKAQSVMQAMMQMKKIDSAKLMEAYEHAAVK